VATVAAVAQMYVNDAAHQDLRSGSGPDNGSLDAIAQAGGTTMATW
jgi:hypothetical protein